MKSGSGGVVTEQSSITPGQYWRYRQSDEPPFEVVVFDDEQLAAQGLIEGMAGAGRGNTFFINFHGSPLVLRHYRRGGLAQRISHRHYVYTGLENTRAMREFDVLEQLQTLQLPAPAPYACEVIRQGIVYRASLVTRRIAGITLAQRLAQGSLSGSLWEAIGNTIARFHAAGLNHADLNAHNIMLDGDDHIALIDFDRARIVNSGISHDGGWCLGNVLRLKRSVQKLALASGVDDADVLEGFELLQNGWRQKLIAEG